jgi:hypothetical protein
MDEAEVDKQAKDGHIGIFKSNQNKLVGWIQK